MMPRCVFNVGGFWDIFRRAIANETMTGFKINLDEKFPHLNNAPIVEAVIGIHARAEKPLDEKTLIEFLKSKLPDYPGIFSHNENSVAFQIPPQGEAPSAAQNLIWKGARLQSNDGLQFAHFNREGFMLSRLFPYKDWDQLSSEAFRLFDIFIDIAKPKEIQRLGLRFVNRFQMPVGDNRFELYIQPHPEPPVGLDLPFSGFFQQDSFAVPDLSYGINLVRTIQPPMPPASPGIGLIIDSDVFTLKPFEFDLQRIRRHFTDMRWLKNRVFFGSITERSMELFR